jgi:hypothetical protein
VVRFTLITYSQNKRKAETGGREVEMDMKNEGSVCVVAKESSFDVTEKATPNSLNLIG